MAESGIQKKVMSQTGASNWRWACKTRAKSDFFLIFLFFFSVFPD
jgi:hypothetical protein